jgi:hypothetical protein
MELAAAFAEEDNLDSFQEDSDFEKEGHKTDFQMKSGGFEIFWN